MTLAAAAATGVFAASALPTASGAWAASTGPVRPADSAATAHEAVARESRTTGHDAVAGQSPAGHGTVADATDTARRPPRGPAHGKSRGAGEAEGKRAGKRSQLTLTYRHAGDQAAKRAVISCAPPHGDHPKARQACRDLTAAGGDFAVLGRDSAGKVCTMLFKPVTVKATGYWNGVPVRWTRTFPNDCLLRQKTASVFSY